MRIWFEQAVYGSFAFWNRGYGVLAHSAGCRPEWLAELRSVCQRYGEPPTGADRIGRLLRITAQEWSLADRGRSFSRLRRPWPSRCAGVSCPVRQQVGLSGSAGSNPFAFEREIRGDWCEHDQHRPLPRGQLTVLIGPAARTNRR